MTVAIELVAGGTPVMVATPAFDTTPTPLGCELAAVHVYAGSKFVTTTVNPSAVGVTVSSVGNSPTRSAPPVTVAVSDRKPTRLVATDTVAVSPGRSPVTVNVSPFRTTVAVDVSATTEIP